MYKIELNIGDLETPVIGGGWVECEHINKDISLTKALFEEEVFARLSLDGGIVFAGDVYDALNTLKATVNKCDIRLTHIASNTVEYTGDLDLLGSWDIDKSECTLKAEVSDNYSKLIDGRDTEINILNDTALLCDVDQMESTLTFYNSLIEECTLFYSPSGYSNFYAQENLITTTEAANVLNGNSDWVLQEDFGDGTSRLSRAWDSAFSSFSSPAAYITLLQLNITVNNPTIIRSYNINDQVGSIDYYLPPPNLYTLYDVTFLRYENGSYPTYETYAFVLVNTYYNSPTISYSRFRLFQGIVEYLAGQIDDNIIIDGDTFSYFDKNEDLKLLAIANVADLKLTAGIEPTNSQTYLYMTWKKLTDWLNIMCKIKWYITSDYKLRFAHRSEINYLVGSNPDLTSLKGVDWSVNKYEYLDDDKYWKLNRKLTAGNPDFIGTDIIAESLENIKKEKKLTTPILTDIWDVQESTTYPDESDDQALILSCELKEISSTNLITGFTNAVSPFSYNYLVFSGGNQLEIKSYHLGQSQCVSNAITVEAGYIYKLSFTLNYGSSGTGELPYLIMTYLTQSTPAITSIGDYEILFRAYKDDSTPQIFISNSIPTDLIFTNMTLTKQTLTGRKASGAISTNAVMNADLAIANLDEGHNQYQLPDPNLEINFDSVTITDTVKLAKDKKVELQAPIFQPSLINERELIKTSLADLEFRSLKVKLDGSMPEIEGAYR